MPLVDAEPPPATWLLAPALLAPVLLRGGRLLGDRQHRTGQVGVVAGRRQAAHCRLLRRRSERRRHLVIAHPIPHGEVAGGVDRTDTQHVVVRRVIGAAGGLVHFRSHVEIVGRVDRGTVASRIAGQGIEQEVEVARDAAVGATGSAGQAIARARRGKAAGAVRPIARQAAPFASVTALAPLDRKEISRRLAVSELDRVQA